MATRGVVEDCMELNDETKREIAEARDEIRRGKVHTLEQVKRERGM